jgi:hypothetical protein
MEIQPKEEGDKGGEEKDKGEDPADMWGILFVLRLWVLLLTKPEQHYISPAKRALRKRGKP